VKSIEDLYKYYANEMNISNEQLAKNHFIFDTRLKVSDVLTFSNQTFHYTCWIILKQVTGLWVISHSAKATWLVTKILK